MTSQWLRWTLFNTDPYRDMIILDKTRGTLGSVVPWCRPQGLVAKRQAQVGMIGDACRVSTLDYMTDGHLDLVFRVTFRVTFRSSDDDFLDMYRKYTVHI